MSQPAPRTSLVHLVVLVALTVGPGAVPPALHAQGVEESLLQLAEDNASLYLEPLTRGLGFTMSGGLLDGARPLGRLGFDFGVGITGALPPTSAKSYEPILPGEVRLHHPTFGDTVFYDPYRIQGGSARTPTVAGDGPGAVLEPNEELRAALVEAGMDPSELEVVLPEGFGIPVVPFPILHASLGLGLGTEASVRFLPTLRIDDEIGELRSTGFAVRHALTTWFTAPVDLSLAMGFQRLEVGEYLEVSSRQYGLLVGRGIGPLTVFGSGMLRSASVEIAYTAENPENHPGLPSDGVRFRVSERIPSDTALGLGARIQFLLMSLSAHYTVDDYPLFSLKAAFGIP